MGQNDGPASGNNQDTKAAIESFRQVATLENAKKSTISRFNSLVNWGTGFLGGTPPAPVTPPPVAAPAATDTATPPPPPPPTDSSTPPPAAAAAPPAAGATPDPNAPAIPPTEEESLLTKVLFSIMPESGKEWAANAAIPMATRGQAIIRQYGRPKVSNGTASILTTFLSGDKITEIPQSINDYSKRIIKMLGLGENEELAESISVGFIAWVKDKLADMGFGKRVKSTYDAAAGSSKLTDLFGFGSNTQTLLGLFSMAPSNEIVDRRLLGALRDAFKTEGVESIDNYFPADETGAPIEMSYHDFIDAYSRLGRDMVASGKWKIDPARITSEMQETAEKTLKKNGLVASDGSPDSALVDGLLYSAIHASDLLKNTVAAKPSDTVTPLPRPGAASPPVTGTG